MDRTSSVSSSNHSTAGASGSDAAQPATAIAGEVAENAKQLASDLANRARNAAEEQLTGVKAQAADRIGNVADALRATSDSLRSQKEDLITSYVDRAVDGLDSASGYLQTHSFGEVVSDLEGFARRQPALVFGGAFILGIFAGRFFKSSSTPRPGRMSSSVEENRGQIDSLNSSERTIGLSGQGAV